MPVNPPQISAPYPSAKSILDLARTLCLDNGISAAGDLLADTGIFTFTLLQSAYEFVQDELANHGYETPIKEVILASVTAVPAAALNPATRVYIDYVQYFDGSVIKPTPVLPQDLLTPLVMKERTAGSNVRFFPMRQANDGLPLRQQYAYMREWDWRDDKIYMVGATQALDFWLRYQAFFPAIASADQPIKIFHGGNAVAYELAYQFASSRNGEVASMFKGDRDDALRQIITRTTHKTMRKNVRRAPYGGFTGSGSGYLE